MYLTFIEQNDRVNTLTLLVKVNCMGKLNRVIFIQTLPVINVYPRNGLFYLVGILSFFLFSVDTKLATYSLICV